MHRKPSTRFRVRPREIGCADPDASVAWVELERGRGGAVDVTVETQWDEWTFSGEDGLVTGDDAPRWVDAVLDFVEIERAEGVEQ